ncbi:hypothetical protein [Phenylobacterium sp.]|uniref:hypothetical protein n=1 Tax=Phenylobacterium sp. TaxID=1871053 RepID=UPI0025EF3E3F|nr:hypothetical protein [Phenylobacterium sp.]
MRTVFELSKQLEGDPEQVALAQALTRNSSKPQMGLAGTLGLFGSEQWWRSINDGRMPLEFVSGVIIHAYRAGQDDAGPTNTVEIRADDDSVRSLGIYVNNPKDRRLFRPGFATSIVYALDELKPEAARNSRCRYSRVALEMSVSLAAVD